VLTRSNPVLMIFEDAHWADPTSLEVLSRAVNRIATLRVLLIVTFRSEFEPPWVGGPYVTALTLNRLPQGEVGVIIDTVIGNKPLPASVRRDIIERTDGIPLFIEEMTKAVLEAESADDARQRAAAVPSPALAVPATLHASLMARLDRLGPAKEVAQIGSAIGREFSHPILAAVVRQQEAELVAALDRLIQAGLLFRQGVPPHATYLFKHALVQDAAYSTLLREPRRALHARIAEAIENRFPDTAESQPELLARHYTDAGLIEKAARMWGKAGQRSLERSALMEAVEQLKRALAQMASARATPALRREQIKLQVGLVNALMHVEGYAAVETKEAVEQARLLIERAEALGEPHEDPLLLFSVLYGFWSANYVGFNGDVMRNLAEQFLALAEKRIATAPLMIGHRLTATALLFTGDVAQSRAYFDRALALYDPAEHRPLTMRFGQDVRVTILCYRALALWLLGYPQIALADTERVINNARETGNAATLMFALSLTGLTLAHCGRYVTAKAQLDEFVALVEEKGTLFWKGFGMLIRGWLFSLTGRPSDAIQMLTSGIAASLSSGTKVFIPEWLSFCATAYADVGKFDDAWRCFDEAMTMLETTKEKWCEAEIQRTAGEIALKSPEPDMAKAEAYFTQALVVARKQQAKSFELRAAMSMARLWRDQGKRQQAHDLLAPVYGWFTEGFDTLDLKEAKALLSDLSS
jgi:predicted ATPase